MWTDIARKAAFERRQMGGFFKKARKVGGTQWYHLGLGDVDYPAEMRDELAKGVRKFRKKKRLAGAKVKGRFLE